MDEPWSAAYAANAAIWKGDNYDASEKTNAWRTQKLLLANATRNLSEATRYDVLRAHQESLTSASSSEEFMQECLNGCQKLLAQRRRGNATTANMLYERTLPPEISFERPCHGVYESCATDELTSSDVQPSGNGELLTTGVIVSKTASAPPITSAPVRRPFAAAAATPVARPYTASPPESAAPADPSFPKFRTAREELNLNSVQNKRMKPNSYSAAPSEIMNYQKKSLGGHGRSLNAKFVQPIRQNEANSAEKNTPTIPPAAVVPSSLAHLDQQMVEQITRESMHKYKSITWDDVAGLEYAKTTFMETIIRPLQRPDLFKGLRRPPRGVLLFGPPGTGKTLIAKCIASQSGATFFSISPSSLTSKWVGDGEKLVRTLFAVAAAHQPAIIFMDEVDSLLSQRSDNEHESSRRLKNEFFIQLDGAATNEDDHIVIIGATNRPQELDEAVRRRFVRRIYITLPGAEARKQIIEKLVKQVNHNLSDAQMQGLAELTEGYSGADMDSLCRYAAMQPLRALSSTQIDAIDAQQLPPVTMSDFMAALEHVSKSVSSEDVERFVTWNQTYGIKY